MAKYFRLSYMLGGKWQDDELLTPVGLVRRLPEIACLANLRLVKAEECDAEGEPLN